MWLQHAGQPAEPHEHPAAHALFEANCQRNLTAYCGQLMLRDP
jgi:hypothetical protein